MNDKQHLICSEFIIHWRALSTRTIKGSTNLFFPWRWKVGEKSGKIIGPVFKVFFTVKYHSVSPQSTRGILGLSWYLSGLMSLVIWKSWKARILHNRFSKGALYKWRHTWRAQRRMIQARTLLTCSPIFPNFISFSALSLLSLIFPNLIFPDFPPKNFFFWRKS